MNATTIGIDLAKTVFQVHGADEKGRKLFSKRLTRDQLVAFMAQHPPCVVGMEACGGSHDWGRRLSAMGHQVRLMSPQYVKPYIKTNKDDVADAQGICEAVTRPSMRFVSIKSIHQQDGLLLHRIRSRLIAQSTQLQNHLRGLLYEYGIVIAKGIAALKRDLVVLLSNTDERLSERAKGLFRSLYEELIELQKRRQAYDHQLKRQSQEDEDCQRLEGVPGVGPVTASAMVAHIGDVQSFKKARDLSAFIGLVPRHHGTGGKTQPLGISKRGDRYLRYLLIHGARAWVKVAMKKQDAYSQWIQALVQRRGMNRAVVAVANKNARIMWALLTYKTCYQAPAC